MRQIILTTLLVAVALGATAQPCSQGSTSWPDCTVHVAAERVASKYTTLIPPTKQATRATEELMNAFYLLGEEGFDQRLDTMDDSWFSGIDVYLHYDQQELMASIESDLEAEFRHNKKATVVVASYSDYYLVAIYSFNTP